MKFFVKIAYFIYTRVLLYKKKDFIEQNGIILEKRGKTHVVTVILQKKIMKPQITFTTDTDTVTEGDVISIQWSCNPADSVRLIIDNGFKTNTIDVEASGIKRFRLNRSKGKTKLTIIALYNGKEASKTIKVKVKEMEVINAETVNDGRAYSGSHSMSWWKKTKMKLLYLWMTLPPTKRIVVIILNFLLVLLVMSLIFPRFLLFGLTLIIIYLTYFLLKK